MTYKGWEYSDEEAKAFPAEQTLGLGCNPGPPLV